MRQDIADQLLKKYHNLIFEKKEYGKAVYAAVVKKSDSNIDNDYYIEVGIKNKLNVHNIFSILQKRNGIDILKSYGVPNELLIKIEDNQGSIIRILSDEDDKVDLQNFTEAEVEFLKFNSNTLNLISDKHLMNLGYSKEIAEMINEDKIIAKDSSTIELLACGNGNMNESNELYKELRGGITISNINVGNYGGTLGGIFKMENDNNKYLLTNAHVLKFGDCKNDRIVVQKDGIPTNDEGRRCIGEMHWMVYNEEIDAGIVKLFKNQKISKNFTRCGKINFGNPSVAKINDIVKKCGRTTGFTKGKVRSINATVRYAGGNRYFYNQIMTTCIADKGDSGSILVNENDNPIGLVFSKTNNHTATFSNHFNKIFSQEKNPNGCAPKITFKKFINS